MEAPLVQTVVSCSSVYTSNRLNGGAHPFLIHCYRRRTYQCGIEWQDKTQTPLPLSHSANEMFLRCVDTHFHQTAAQAAGVHPQGPFKVKDLAALAVKSLQGAGTSWTTALETHAWALWQGRRKKGPNGNENRVNIWCLLFCEINVFSEMLYN